MNENSKLDLRVLMEALQVLRKKYNNKFNFFFFDEIFFYEGKRVSNKCSKDYDLEFLYNFLELNPIDYKIMVEFSSHYFGTIFRFSRFDEYYNCYKVKGFLKYSRDSFLGSLLNSGKRFLTYKDVFCLF